MRELKPEEYLQVSGGRRRRGHGGSSHGSSHGSGHGSSHGSAHSSSDCGGGGGGGGGGNPCPPGSVLVTFPDGTTACVFQ